MLMHAHMSAIPLILFLGIISVQDSLHSLLIPSVFHVYVHILLRADKHLLLKLHVMLFCWNRYQNLQSGRRLRLLKLLPGNFFTFVSSEVVLALS